MIDKATTQYSVLYGSNNNREMYVFTAPIIEKNGTITQHITVSPESDYFDIKEVVYNGSKVIYANEFIIDNELLNAINNIM